LLEQRVRGQLAQADGALVALVAARVARGRILGELGAQACQADERRRQECECPICGLAVDAFDTERSRVNVDIRRGSPRKRTEIEAAKQLDTQLVDGTFDASTA
jgi:hypothetical protein